MKVFLTSAYPYNPKKNFAAKWLLDSAIICRFKKHTICNNPNYADIILFVEHHSDDDPYFFRVVKSNLYEKFKKKCYLYHDNDQVLPLIPGIFPSIEKKYYYSDFIQPGPYIARLCINTEIKYPNRKPSSQYLFSFVGALKTHPIRKIILGLEHDKCFLEDTSGKNSWELDSIKKKEFEKKYVDISLASKFVLCPRGHGPNSYRLYETMEMGIAPVIISDEWVPVIGPEWDSFSIHIPENQIKSIPIILDKREKEAEEMGKKARIAWENWFSKEVCFHHIVESCEKLHKYKDHRYTNWVKIYSQFLQPFHFRNLLRYTKRKLFK